MKNFFFLCGLPRAGNTLLASLMNQNPDVAVTANSMVADIFSSAEMLKNQHVYKNYTDEESLDNITRGILPNYYSHWKANNIIDRSTWGMPKHFDVLKKFIDNPKVIVLVRDLKEILASFVKYSYSSNNNYITDNSSSLIERCEYIMGDDGSLRTWVECVWNLNKPENRKYCYFVEYNDLVSNPQKEIKQIYEFLGIEPFEHHYTNLSQLENNGIKYDDSVLGEGLHKVKEDNISKTDYDIWDYLPKNVDEQYRLEPFWR
tara:strand:+ start:547 stop:1326 length:780 start_codon:yes stop_codon:yes gene_type:complete